jgi:hypothetical protein
VRATEAEDVVPESERLREQLEVLREELAAVREAIGEAWFVGGVDTATALRRKTAALERLSGCEDE